MKMYALIEEVKTNSDEWTSEYDESKLHTGKYYYGKTPLNTFEDSLHIAKEKNIDFTLQTNHENHEGVSLSSV